jgi:hypothetical protein
MQIQQERAGFSHHQVDDAATTRCFPSLPSQCNNKYSELGSDNPEPVIVSRVLAYHAPSIELSALLLGKNRNAAAKALVDSGATGNLISQKFAARQRMIPQVLDRPIPLKNVDDSESLIRSYLTIPMVLQDHQGRKHRETISMYIANIGQQDIILGTGWLIKHNPEINWKTYNLAFT